MAYFPAEWQDDSRMSFMFSAFPENRNVNPKHWDSKLQFWRNAIVESCDSFDELCFDINLLKSRFRRKGVTPLGLNTVMKEMWNSGEIISTGEFLDSVYDTWSAWSYGMAKRSLWWTVGKVWESSTATEGTFVLLASVKKKAEKVLSCHYQTVKHSITDNIVPEKVLKTRLKASNVELTEQEFEIVVCQLRKERLLSVQLLESGEKVFKFAEKNERKVAEITETDLSILRLKKAEATIQLQIRKLQKDIEELHAIVVTSVKQRLRNKAKKILSRKHALSSTLDKKESLLLNTQDILRRIQDAHSDANVLEALKAGAQVFKTMSQESGLTIDNVEKIMGEVEDVIDETAEIDRTISEGSKSIAATSGLPGDDVEDLEKELEALMLDDKTGSKLLAPTSGLPNDDTEELEKELEALKMGTEKHGPADEKRDLLSRLPDVRTSSPGRDKTREQTRVALTS